MTSTRTTETNPPIDYMRVAGAPLLMSVPPTFVVGRLSGFMLATFGWAYLPAVGLLAVDALASVAFVAILLVATKHYRPSDGMGEVAAWSRHLAFVMSRVTLAVSAGLALLSAVCWAYPPA